MSEKIKNWFNVLSVSAFVLTFLFLFSFAPRAEAATFGLTSTGSTSYSQTNIGNNATGTALNSADYLEVDKYTTTVPLTAMTIHTYGTASGNVKVSIYSNASGYPGTLLFTEVAGSETANTWSNITINNIYLVAGTYWIAFNKSVANGVTHSTGVTGAVRFWQSYAYATAFPINPLSTSWTTAAVGTQDDTYFTAVSIEGYAKATKATLSNTNSAINSVAFYSHATGNFRLAIYSDSSGPNSKLWESGSTAASASAWNTVNISSGTPTNLTLNSGNYWLVWQWDSVNNGPSYTAGSSGDGNYITQVYGSFPSSWSGGTSSSEKYSVYVNYTPDTTPPTVTSVAIQSLTTINVTFSEAMGTGVTTAANYTISESGKGTLATNPTSVALVSGNTYALTWSSGSLANAADVTITVANAQDLAGNVVGSPNSGLYIIRAILDVGAHVKDFLAGVHNHFRFH